MSTGPTTKSSTDSNPLSAAARIIADLPDDRLRVSELIQFYELLIKGQLEEYLHDTKARRKIRNLNDSEGLKRAIEEDPTLLHKLREATRKAF